MTMNKNMKLWKYSGTFLVITGAIHTVYALLLGKEDFTDMIKGKPPIKYPLSLYL